MSKLHYRYSCMGSGKSTQLLQVAHNYESRGLKVLTIKPKFDTRDGEYISSRLGIEREVDYLVKSEDDIFEIINEFFSKSDYACVLVDEANFLTKEQARQLWRVAVELDVPVIAYGLRVDYKGEGFEGSKELLTLAHEIEELVTVDETGKKCTMHLRSIDGKYVFEGESLIVGDIQGEEKYESCTAKKWLREWRKSERGHSDRNRL